MRVHFSIQNSISVTYSINKLTKAYGHLSRCRHNFDKIKYTFMLKTLQEVFIESTFLNIIETIHDKLTANILDVKCRKHFL